MQGQRQGRIGIREGFMVKKVGRPKKVKVIEGIVKEVAKVIGVPIVNKFNKIDHEPDEIAGAQHIGQK